MALTGAEEEVVAQVLAGLAADDAAGVRALLHPYLHWTCDGVTTRGRTQVLALLDREGPAARRPPTAVELRDGQVYRWTVTGVPA